MFTLLRNYIREQKNSWLQIMGLGFLVIIMVTTFLSLNFSTTYLTNQYNNEIAQNQYHQNISFKNPDDDVEWFKSSPYKLDADNQWLENMNYYYRNQHGDVTINEAKLKNATFQLIHGEGYSKNAHNYVYKFIYSDDKSLTSDTSNVAVGQDFAKKTNHGHIDFKLTIPLNFPETGEQHLKYLDDLATMIESLVYDGNHPENQVNFFITSSIALEKYEALKAAGEIPYAKKDYNLADIRNQSKFYQLLIMGMLYGDNGVSWRRVSTLNDIIMTGKTLAFIQTTPQDVVGKPVLTKNGGESLAANPLKDNEILIYQDFARHNNLKIGDSYIFAAHKFIIRGYATSAVVAAKNQYFATVDDKNQSVAFVNQNTFNQIISDPYTKALFSDFVAFNPEVASKNIAPTINNYWLYSYFNNLYQKKLTNGTLYSYSLKKPLSNSIDAAGLMEPLNYNKYYNNVFESNSLSQLNSLKSIFNQISSVFLTLIFIVTTVIIFIIIFKMIDRNKQLIGILKANGYQSWKLNVALTSSIIVPLVIFAILGAIIAIFLSKFIIIGFSSTFALLTTSFSFYLLPTILVIAAPILVLFVISFLIVAYLLRTPPLTLINNSWSKNKYNFSIGLIFSFLTNIIIKKFNYRNKLVITNAFRSLGKLTLILVVSFFASTLVLFALASNGLINNMLGLQFASINYNFGSQYSFNEIRNNFVSDNKEMLYKKADVQDIKSQPSLYMPIRQAVLDYLNNPSSHPMVNFRYGYVMGSELFKIRHEVIEPNLDSFPETFQKFWYQNIYYIDYLTNDNGKSNVDLMVNFGLLAYDNKWENPYSLYDFTDSHNFDVNNFDTTKIYYDNDNDVLVGNWDSNWSAPRISYGINSQTSQYLSPGFSVTNFDKFSELNLADMEKSSWWQDQNFISVRNQIIKKLGIKNPDYAAVQVIPMVGSTAPTINNVTNGGDGNYLNKIVIYRYKGLDKQTKYVFGVIYDGAKNLPANTVLMPEKWINQIIFGTVNQNLVSNFANAKFTKLNNNELHYYLPIISNDNDYNLDISQIMNGEYLASKGIASGLSKPYDVNAIKELIKAQQYTFQVLLSFFGVFLVLLTLMIVIIISNINIRDNLILINILRSLGYTFFEISYIFLIIAIPLLILCGVFAIYVAPVLVTYLSVSLSKFTGIFFPVVFQWWYIALSFLTIIVIYILSFLITWKLNVNHRQLMKLTK